MPQEGGHPLEDAALGAVDDDGVDVRDVQPVFDDSSGEEDVELACHEIEHGLLELVLVHLAVAHDDFRFGNETCQEVADGVKS